MPKLKDLFRLPEFVRDHKLAYTTSSHLADYDGVTKVTEDVNQAQFILSSVDDGTTKTEATKHRPIIDVDHRIQAVESTTPGHYHLYIDKEMTWSQFEALLEVFVEVGLVEPGYLRACKRDKASSVRLPWVKKVLPL